MAKIACKVVDRGKNEVFVEVLVDGLSENEERKVHDKVEELATFIANLKGLQVQGKSIAI